MVTFRFRCFSKEFNEYSVKLYWNTKYSNINCKTSLSVVEETLSLLRDTMMTKKSKKIKHGQINRSDQSVQSDQSEDANKIQCLEELFDYLSRNYSLYSQSIDDYIQNKKPSLRRRVIYHTITFKALLTSIMYLMIYN